MDSTPASSLSLGNTSTYWVVIFGNFKITGTVKSWKEVHLLPLAALFGEGFVALDMVVKHNAGEGAGDWIEGGNDVAVDTAKCRLII